MIHPTNPIRRALIALALTATAGLSHAQANVIRFVVPFPAGGVTDQVARLMAEKMGQDLGQTVIVENRPGAGSRIGIDAVMRAQPDGQTLLFTNSSYSILPIVDPKVSFDPQKSLLPVGMAATYGLQVVTSAAVPANNLGEFIAYAKSNPGKLSYGSAGTGSGAHFAGEFFKSLTGTYIVHIPYKSTSAALNDVAAGLVELTFDAAAKPLIDARKVKLLAVTDNKRDPRFPDAPTAAEAGLKPFVLQSWVGLLAPVGTPAANLERLNKAVAAAAADPGVRARFADLGLQPQGGPSSRFASMITDEVALYRKIATTAKLKFD
jgi:tripartite-type tricarboxylate transporter receptor subunit TctC